ncbi:MAG: hypothetical protein Q7T17_09450 [Microbacterium sp.]|uniref:glycosyltransferase family protein n=1 Tax=Microbacterium sp. TaxID=51671 RepID=UPI002725BBFE|nr:hypothetical protein [Microbacterium sp.]MDO8383188.1 hypothetical protein [Microbacterium sp.]
MRILVVSPAFFGYERAITEAFREQGHDAVFLDERPSNLPAVRAIVRAFPWVLRRKINRHYRRALAELGNESFEGVVVIKGEVVPAWFLAEIVRLNPSARMVYYTFDSIKNSPQGQRILGYFHRKFSFDPADVAAYPSFELKPLFFPDDFRPGDAERDLDISFVGTLHGDRYPFIQAVAAQIPPERRKLYYYLPARWFFFLRKLSSRGLRGVSQREVSFTPLARSEVVRTAQRSRVVIDLQREGQTGLTMRTFEVLATGAAIITANEAIREQPFFSNERVLVVPRAPERVDTNIVSAFIARQPDVGTAPPGFDEYSLSAWVADFVTILAQSDGEPDANPR